MPNARASRARGIAQPGTGIAGKIGANPQNALLAEETITLAAIAGYDLFGQTDTKKLPSPGPILAGLGFFSILSLIGSFGAQAGRAVSLIGAVITVTVLVTGARGKSIVHLIQRLATFGKVPAAQAAG